MPEIPKIISVDDHVIEPPNVWQDRLPEKFKAVGPRIERRKIKSMTFVGGVFSYEEAGANEQHPTSDCRPTSAIRGSIGDAGALRGFEPRDCRQVDRERPARDQTRVSRAEVRHVGIPTLRRWTIRICAPRMVRQLWEILIRVI